MIDPNVIKMMEWEATDRINAAGDQIKNLQAENAALRVARRWIPVGERLPEKQEFYPLLTQSMDGRFFRNLGQYVRCLGWADHKGNAIFQVTHWMPLPPDPEGT